MRLTIFIMAFILILSGCSLTDSGQGESPAEDEVTDAEYPVTEFGAALDSRPGIIVSLSPSLTDKLADLGLTERLEGVSDYCDLPGDGVERVRVGDARSPDIDAIRGLSPHLLVTEAELSSDDYLALIQSGVEIALIPRANSVEEVISQYEGLARLLDGNRSGGALGERFRDEIERRLEDASKNGLAEPKNALYLRELDFTVATGGTLENELMELIGLNNIAAGQSDWVYFEEEAKSEEGIAAFSSIDLILMDERYVTITMLEQNGFYKGLKAVIEDRYLYIDMAAFERGGLRMFDELLRIARELT